MDLLVVKQAEPPITSASKTGGLFHKNTNVTPRKSRINDSVIKLILLQRIFILNVSDIQKKVPTRPKDLDGNTDEIHSEIITEFKEMFGEEWLKEALDFTEQNLIQSGTKLEILKSLRELIVDDKKLEEYINYLTKNYNIRIRIIKVSQKKVSVHNGTAKNFSQPSGKQADMNFIRNSGDLSVVKKKKNRSRSNSIEKSGKEIIRSVDDMDIKTRTPVINRNKNYSSSGSSSSKEKKNKIRSNSNKHTKIIEKIDIEDRKLKAFSWEVYEKNLLYQEEIGKGAYGLVFKAKYKHKDIAVKRYVYVNQNNDPMSHILREISLISQLKHKNVVQFIGASLGENVCVLLEYCSKGDLNSFLYQSMFMSWKAKLRFSLEIANGLKYIHSMNIYHRDLKASNILVTEKENLKICDFGSAKRMSELNTGVSGSDANVGTINWCAPEILFLEEQFTTKADIYSYGMVCYEVVSKGKIPFGSLNPLQTIRAIEEGKKPKVDFPLVKTYQTLMELCWERDQEKRPTLDTIISTLTQLTKSSLDQSESK